MNISILIPQLFYDLIGRVIPGATLISCAFLLFRGTFEGVQYLTAWSSNSVFVLLGNLLASYIVGSLLGGMWFRLYRIDFFRRPWKKEREKKCEHSWWIKWVHGWSRNGEIRIDDALDATYGQNKPNVGNLKMSDMSSAGRIALIYDYIQLCSPKAGARIAKLRAEQHMSGVLMIGFFILAVIALFPSLRYSEWSLWKLEAALLFASMTSGWLAWHLEKRSGTALYYSWFLVWSGIAKESEKPDSKKD